VAGFSVIDAYRTEGLGRALVAQVNILRRLEGDLSDSVVIPPSVYRADRDREYRVSHLARYEGTRNMTFDSG
jgi:hypothetical protein